MQPRHDGTGNDAEDKRTKKQKQDHREERRPEPQARPTFLRRIEKDGLHRLAIFAPSYFLIRLGHFLHSTLLQLAGI
jgi:hypothetical protein